MLAALLTRIGLDMAIGKARERLRYVPWQVWAAIACLVLIGAGLWWHGNAVEAHYTEAYAAGAADKAAEYDAALAKAHRNAADWRARYEAASASLTETLGDLHDAQARNIAARANDLRLRGPGKARVCSGPGDRSGPAAGTGRHEPAGGSSDDTLARVPADEPLAIVPWGQLVDFGEAHDIDRDEVLTWRRWYRANEDLLAGARAKLEER